MTERKRNLAASVSARLLAIETGRIYSLLAKVSGAIDRLKEFPTALISAALTGKIDVRKAASRRSIPGEALATTSILV